MPRPPRREFRGTNSGPTFRPEMARVNLVEGADRSMVLGRRKPRPCPGGLQPGLFRVPPLARLFSSVPRWHLNTNYESAECLARQDANPEERIQGQHFDRKWRGCIWSKGQTGRWCLGRRKPRPCPDGLQPGLFRVPPLTRLFSNVPRWHLNTNLRIRRIPRPPGRESRGTNSGPTFRPEIERVHSVEGADRSMVLGRRKPRPCPDGLQPGLFRVPPLTRLFSNVPRWH